MLLILALALIPALAGCEAGENAPTLDFHQPTDGAGTAVDNISIRNVFVLGAPLGSVLQPGQSASVFFALVNTGSNDTLLGITAPGSAASVRIIGGPVPLATRTVSRQGPVAVYFTGPQPHAYLVNLTRALANGTSITLVLHFKNAGAVTLEVPVEAQAAQYSYLSPPPTAAPTPTATIAGHRHRSRARGTSSPSPSPSP
jgi:copper(I)-binding protein